MAYEVLWARMLDLQFGASAYAVVVTVAAFMLGLAGGSAFAGERAVRNPRPLRTLALLEAGIAAFSLLLPWVVRAATPWLDVAAGSLSPLQWRWLLTLAALALLSLPAAAMGAGFPLLVEGWRSRGGNVAAAYGSNTLGAAAGALLPLALLPAFGWSTALRCVALASLCVAAGLGLLERRTVRALPARRPVVAARPGVALALNYALIGAASLMLEMAWVRLFSLVMLRTEYVLALILAVMLLGIGAGSLLAGRVGHALLLRALPWCAAGFAIAGLWLLAPVSAWMEQARFYSLGGAMVGDGLLLAALTLPVTLALGAWLPALSAQHRVTGASFYAVNSFGGAVGAAAYVGLLPWIGSCGALVLAALLLLIAGLVLAGARRAWLAVPLVVASAWPVHALPEVRALLPRAFAGSRDLYRFEDAVAITQVVEQADGQRVLLTDLRRRDASSEPTAVYSQANQARLPLLLHPGARSVLFLGIGTGISLAGSLPYRAGGLVRSAVELSAGSTAAANRFFAESNGRVLEQTRVTQDDARHFLSATPDRYDLIVGDLFHPDLAGAGALLSVEQFQRARRRLAGGGLFVQWLALNQFDSDTLAVVMRSFREVFPEAQLFLDGMHLALVGPRDRWQGVALTERAADGNDAGGEGPIVWLGRYWGPIRVDSGPAQHEWAPVIEYRLPRLQYESFADTGVLQRELLARRPGVEESARLLHVPPDRRQDFRRAFVATELWVRSQWLAVHGSMLEADRLLGLAYEAEPQDRWIEYSLSDRLLASLDASAEHGLSREQMLRKILAINPWSVDAWRALWALQVGAGDTSGAAASRERILQLSPFDRAARGSEPLP